MYRHIIRVIILLLYIPVIAYAANTESDYVLTTEQAIAFVDQQQEAIWSGFHVSSTPSIIHFDNNNAIHIYAFNLLPKNPDWQKVLVNGTSVSYLGKDEYNVQGVGADYNLDAPDLLGSPFIIDGQPAYIYQALSNDAELNSGSIHDVHVLIHERFHGYQFKNFLPNSSWNFAQYNGSHSITNISLAYLEVEPLKNYLLTGSEEALKNFVAVNKYRNQLLNKDAEKFEEQKEDMEGIADYVGWKSVNLPDANYKNAIVKDYNDGNQCTLSTYSEINGCMENWRYYFVGDAMAIALDQSPSRNNWKQLLQTSGTSIRSQLFQYYPMNDIEINMRVANTETQYNYDQLMQKTITVMMPYLNEIAQQEKNYQNLPGIELNIDSAACQQTTSNSKNQYEINTQKNLLTDVTETANCPDQTLAIQYNDISLLYEQHIVRILPQPHEITRSEFKVPATINLVVDNNTQPLIGILNARKIIPFHQLSIDTSQVHISVSGINGTLDTTHGDLRIRFTQNINPSSF